MYTDFIEEPKERLCFCCGECDAYIDQYQPVYMLGGKWICEECLEEHIENDFLASEIAEALGIEKTTPAALEE